MEPQKDGTVSLFSASTNFEDAKSTLQVAKEAFEDELLDRSEFEATLAELKATFRRQIRGDGLHSNLSEAQLLQLEEDSLNPPSVKNPQSYAGRDDSSSVPSLGGFDDNDKMNSGGAVAISITNVGTGSAAQALQEQDEDAAAVAHATSTTSVPDPVPRPSVAGDDAPSLPYLVLHKVNEVALNDMSTISGNERHSALSLAAQTPPRANSVVLELSGAAATSSQNTCASNLCCRPSRNSEFSNSCKESAYHLRQVPRIAVLQVLSSIGFSTAIASICYDAALVSTIVTTGVVLGLLGVATALCACSKAKALLFLSVMTMLTTSITGASFVYSSASTFHLACDLKQSVFMDCDSSSCPELAICLGNDMDNGDCGRALLQKSECGCEARSSEDCDGAVLFLAYATAMAYLVMSTALCGIALIGVIKLEVELAVWNSKHLRNPWFGEHSSTQAPMEMEWDPLNRL